VDSAAARAAAARRDSLAAQARADSLARANQEQARADSVRAEVQRQGADTGSGVSPGLAAADAAELADAVHFEYDKADLRPAEQAKLDRKIRLLQAHPRLEIQIAGNCDERGSVEYNLALGERRAAVAKRYLVAHGIAAGRVSVVSYGEERPVDPGHSEEAWAKNRRDDFVATRGAN
jgi:peptidoglycan-associated lipoprotein